MINISVVSINDMINIPVVSINDMTNISAVSISEMINISVVELNPSFYFTVVSRREKKFLLHIFTQAMRAVVKNYRKTIKTRSVCDQV